MPRSSVSLPHTAYTIPRRDKHKSLNGVNRRINFLNKRDRTGGRLSRPGLSESTKILPCENYRIRRLLNRGHFIIPHLLKCFEDVCRKVKFAKFHVFLSFFPATKVIKSLKTVMDGLYNYLSYMYSSIKFHGMLIILKYLAWSNPTYSY